MRGNPEVESCAGLEFHTSHEALSSVAPGQAALIPLQRFLIDIPMKVPFAKKNGLALLR